MASLVEKQIVRIHILPNIAKDKDNQTTKFTQLIEDNVPINFLKKSFWKNAKRLVPDFFLFYKKALYKIKAKRSEL